MKIEQQFDPTFVKKFKRHQRIGKFLYGSKFQSLFARLASVARSIENDIKRRERSLKFEETRRSGNTSEHGYTDRYGDLKAALNYAIEVHSPGFSVSALGESYMLYQEQLNSMREILKQGDVKRVFNFGICYAHIDALLAQEFPDVKFIGIDLSEHNKAFNECEFGHISNLEIITGDVFATFEKLDFEGALLFHSRTLVLLPTDFIKKFYAAAHKAGFRWVFGFEQHGLSEETVTPYTFDLSDRPSVYWRDRMYIHNYLGLVEEAGFKVTSADNFSTNHTSSDYKVLRFVGSAS